MTATQNTAADRNMLPGEAAPLQYSKGRGPITENEALGVLRRFSVKEILSARKNTKITQPPTELPALDAKKNSHIFRLPPRDIAFARARAEMEGLTLTDIVEASLRAYAYGTPQKPLEFR